MFFDNIKNVSELKQVYRQLALKFHPDKGGDTATMQAINREYQDALTRLLAEGKITIQEFAASEDIMETVNAIIHLPGISVEICGTWVWVSGDTRPVKEELKANGFFWAFKKKKWYWRAKEQKRTYRRTPKSMDWIRSRYGSETPEQQQGRRIS